jgi:molybdopterin-guanine dinucleotide biosynthesis protein A
VEKHNLDACLPATRHGLEPMHAVYRVETCLPLVKAAIDRDLWRMNAWHDQAKLKVVAPDEVFQVTGCEHTFLNLNTPEDLEKAEEIARDLQGTGC